MVSTWSHARSIGRPWCGWCAQLRTSSLFSHCWLCLWLLSSLWPRYRSFCTCMWCWAYSFQCYLNATASLFVIWRMPPSLPCFLVVSLLPFPWGCIVLRKSARERIDWACLVVYFVTIDPILAVKSWNQASFSWIERHTEGDGTMMLRRRNNGVARIFFWGGHPVHFRHLSWSRPYSVGGGGSSRNVPCSQLPDRIQWGGGGGVVAEIFPLNKSITFPRFRDIFGTFSGHLRIIRRLWTLAEIQGHFPCLLAHSNHVTTSIHSGKKTFTKSLGGPWPPWPPPLATPLRRNVKWQWCYVTIYVLTRTFAVNLQAKPLFLSVMAAAWTGSILGQIKYIRFRMIYL